MAKAHFRTNVLLKSIIGKDLITDDNIAVLELVKNSFDANSKRVEIYLLNIEKNDDAKLKDKPSKNSSKIIIKDTGIGMSESDLNNKWLNIAYSEKKAKKEEYGRLLAGNKGVGRFSCDKLGLFLDIYTKKKGGDFLHLFINWKKFEVDNKIELDIQKIELEINIIPSKSFKHKTGYEPFENGTILEISKLREEWNSSKILNLKRQLEKLINPNQAYKKNTFEIEIIAPEYKKQDTGKEEYQKINGDVKNRIFEKLNFRTSSIESSISDDGKTITTILKDRGIDIFKLTELNRFKLLKNINIHVYYLNTYSKIYFNKQTGIRSKDFGSISLFINGFRIPPYGDDGDDWLGLEIRKGQGHSRYLGTREVVGRIEINDQDDQYKIISSRTGVVNNLPFIQLTKSDSPFGYFLKTFRRLERFVSEGIKWDSVIEEKGLEERVKKPSWKEKNETYAEDELSRNKRIISVINNIIDAKKDEVVDLNINEDFVLKIVKEQTNKAKKDLDKIFTEVSSKNLTQEELTDFIQKLENKTRELGSFSKTVSNYKNLSKNETKKLKTIYTKYEEKYAQLVKEKTLVEKKLAKEEEARKKAEEAQKKAEEEKQKAEEALQKERKKNTFFNATGKENNKATIGLIHHIKLTSTALDKRIKILAKDVVSDKIDKTKTLEILQELKVYSEKILKLSEIVSYSDLNFKYDKHPGDLVRFITEYINEIKPGMPKVNFVVHTNNASFTTDFSILELSIIIDNLISNSLKSNNNATKIQIDIDKVKKGIKLVFSDNGNGISDEITDQIFDLGFTSTRGSGIGLYTVKDLMNQMGGDIKFIGNKKVLKGASFELTF